jgi:hypothetical protein
VDAIEGDVLLIKLPEDPFTPIKPPEKRPNLSLQSYLRLSKENFWDELTEKYQLQMLEFTAWIDGYKERTNWNVLFNNFGHRLSGTDEIKYHDLPFAMQLGIFIEYQMDAEKGIVFPGSSLEPEDLESWIFEIKNWFRDVAMEAQMP